MKYLERYWAEAFAVLLFIWGAFGDTSLQTVWMARWWLVASVSVVAFGIAVGTRVHIAVGAIVISTLLSAVNTALWGKQFSEMPWEVQMGLRLSSATAGLILMVCLHLVLCLKRSTLTRILSMLTTCGLLYPIVIYVRWGTGQDVHSYLPLFDNPSMAASFTVLSLLLVDRGLELAKLTPHRCLLWAYSLGAILLTKSSTPLLALSLGVGARFLMAKHETKVRVMLGGALVTPVLAALALRLDPWQAWVSDSGRFWIWGHYIRKWWESGLVLSGFGVGTTKVLFPLLSADPDYKFGGTFILWLHNDWLQVFMEQGILGGSCFLYFAFTTFKQCQGRPGMMAALAAFGGVMWTNFPFHMAPFALMGLLLVSLAYMNKGEV